MPFGYTFEDDAVIHQIARKARVSADAVKGREHMIGSLDSKVATSVVSRNYIDRLTGEDIGYIDDNSYVEILKKVIFEFAKKDRVQFLKENYGLSEKRAKKEVEEGDKRRDSLYRMLTNRNYEDPMLYNLIINTSRIDIDKAVDMVCRLVE